MIELSSGGRNLLQRLMFVECTSLLLLHTSGPLYIEGSCSQGSE